MKKPHKIQRLGHVNPWRMPTSSRVQFAGVDSSTFANNGELNGGAGGLTMISGVLNERCRQHGHIRQVQAFIISPGAAGKQIKFKVFRPNGLNYDFVSESEKITPTLTGATETFDLAYPMACQPGDVLGVWIEADNVPKVAIAAVTIVGANSIRYTAGDILGTEAFGSTINNLAICIEGFGISPYLAVTGDSIGEGQTAWLSHYDAGPAGTLTSEPWYILRSKIPQVFQYQNHCRGAQTYTWVDNVGFVSAEATGAKTILIVCGVNDVSAARAWADVDANLDSIKVQFAASTAAKKLLISEILPWTAGSDAQAATIRTWNANLAAWCTANGATLVPCHDVLAQVRGSTGELDDLLAAYDLDGVHLTVAGYTALAAIVRTYL